jgi:hypothetical protein
MIINLTKNNLVNNLKFQLKKNNLKIKIIIFSKINLDSFIISKYLTAVLKSKFISYELFLIKNQSEINEFYKKKMKVKNHYLIFFFINFGANIKLDKFFLTNYNAIKKIFLFDFHKCYYYKNLTSHSILIFFDRLYLKHYFYKIFDRNKVLVQKKNYFFFSNNLLNIIPDSQFNIYDKIWLDIIYTSNLYILGIITRKKYRNLIFYIGKKFDYIKKRNIESDDIFFNKKSKLITFKKTKDFSIFLLKHSSLLDALVNTPSFSLKFRLWKHSGILKLSQFFNRLGFSFSEIKNSWVRLKPKVKEYFKRHIVRHAKYFGINVTKMNSFTKIFNPLNIYETDKFNKVSNIDFVFVAKSMFDLIINKKINLVNTSYWKMYDIIFDLKAIKYGIRNAKKSQNYVNKMGRIIISKKTYINEIFFRYSFLQNLSNINLTQTTLRNLSFYLMLAFYQKFQQKKAFFVIMQFKNQSIITGSFFNNVECKKIKEKLILDKNIIIENSDCNNSKTLILILNKGKEADLFKNIITFYKYQ